MLSCLLFLFGQCCIVSYRYILSIDTEEEIEEYVNDLVQGAEERKQIFIRELKHRWKRTRQPCSSNYAQIVRKDGQLYIKLVNFCFYWLVFYYQDGKFVVSSVVTITKAVFGLLVLEVTTAIYKANKYRYTSNLELCFHHHVSFGLFVRL